MTIFSVNKAKLEHFENNSQNKNQSYKHTGRLILKKQFYFALKPMQQIFQSIEGKL